MHESLNLWAVLKATKEFLSSAAVDPLLGFQFRTSRDPIKVSLVGGWQRLLFSRSGKHLVTLLALKTRWHRRQPVGLTKIRDEECYVMVFGRLDIARSAQFVGENCVAERSPDGRLSIFGFDHHGATNRRESCLCMTVN